MIIFLGFFCFGVANANPVPDANVAKLLAQCSANIATGVLLPIIADVTPSKQQAESLKMSSVFALMSILNSDINTFDTEFTNQKNFLDQKGIEMVGSDVSKYVAYSDYIGQKITECYPKANKLIEKQEATLIPILDKMKLPENKASTKLINDGIAATMAKNFKSK